MRLNGWHRLWILTSLVTLAALAVVAAAVWPNEAGVPHTIGLYDKLSTVARDQITESESEAGASVRMPNDHVIHLKPAIAASRKTDALLEYQAAVLEQVREKQTQLVVKLLAWWASACITVLAIGHLIAWVRAGFARPTP